jgi:hypothetical protein
MDDTAGEIQFHKHDIESACVEAYGTHEGVDIDWGRAERFQHAGAVGFLQQGGGAGGGGCQGPMGLLSEGDVGSQAREWYPGFDNVVGRGDQRGAALQQAVWAFGVRVERVAGDGEDLAALFAGKVCGDECSGAVCRFDDEDSQRDAGNDSIAPSGVLGAGLEARRHVGDDRAFFGDSLSEGCVLRRIDDVDAAGDHGDGSGFKSGFMRGCVDAAVEPRDDDSTGVSEIARQLAGQFVAGCGGLARADDWGGESGEDGKISAHIERRRLDRGKCWR